ncbi:MAG: hypothetical protein OEZ08_12115, partial [Betaproteobacteria bacterium]|nr:hypothetical protein [Betaproteobacteria bacterium]
EVRGGLCGGVRVHVAVEEHGAGRQNVNFRVRAQVAHFLVAAALAGAMASAFAFVDRALFAGAVLAGLVALLAFVTWFECAKAASGWASGMAHVRANRRSGD